MKPQRIHLLLVEDDDLDVMNVHRALGQAAEIASITVCRDGVEAMKLLRTGTLPQERLVIVLDLRMPRMSGLEVLRELRADPAFAATPVVALTAYAMQGDREKAKEAGFTSYVTKPVNLLELRKHVAELLDSAGSREQDSL